MKQSVVAGSCGTVDGKLYSERSREDWLRLPVLTCRCGQVFYQQVSGIVDCDDCLQFSEHWAAYYLATRGVEISK